MCHASGTPLSHPHFCSLYLLKLYTSTTTRPTRLRPSTRHILSRSPCLQLCVRRVLLYLLVLSIIGLFILLLRARAGVIRDCEKENKISCSASSRSATSNHSDLTSSTVRQHPALAHRVRPLSSSRTHSATASAPERTIRVREHRLLLQCINNNDLSTPTTPHLPADKPPSCRVPYRHST